MAYDVVEQPVFLGEIGDVHRQNINVAQAEFCDDLPAHGDLASRKIDPHESSLGKAQGHGNEVAAPCAAQFQDLAVLDWRRRQSVECRDGRQMIRVRVREAVVRVRDFIIAR